MNNVGGLIMKKYQKPELTIFNLIAKNEFAAAKYKDEIPGEGGVPLSVYEISSFDETSGTE